MRLLIWYASLSYLNEFINLLDIYLLRFYYISFSIFDLAHTL